jgi:hypothetical protein
MATRYNYTGGIVTNGLVLNLDAAKVDSYPGTGTTWRDLSGNNNNGTLTNGPTFSGIGKQASIVFDGVDDYVSVPNFDYGRTAFTAEAWIMYTANTNGYKTTAIGSWETGAGRNNQWVLFSEGASSNAPYWPGFAIQSTTNNLYIAQDTSTIMVTNTWYQMCGVFDGSSVKIYLNGSLKNTNNIGSTVTVYNNNNNIQVGSFATSYFTQCKITSTKLYNRALSAAEVSQNFNALRNRYGI